MSTTFPHASPALDELLVELDQVKDPRLFGINPGQFARGMRGNINPIGTREAGLSSLEELILEAHRDELARMLMDAALFRMGEESLIGAAVSCWTRVENQATPGRLPEYVPDSSLQYLSPFIEREILRYGGFASLFEKAPARLLGFLSCRLVASHHRRATFATVLGFTGSPASGLSSLVEVLHDRPDASTYRWALQNAGVLAWRLGNLQRALEWIEQVAAAPLAGVSPKFDYLSLAVRSQDNGALAQAARLASDSIDVDQAPFLDSVAGTLKVLQSPGGEPHPSTIQFARSQIDDLPSVAHQFLAQTFCRQDDEGTAGK